MDGPVYKLEHVVRSREGMEDFEGPLDLILFLLSKNKIEIQDIPISLILDQYLEYLAEGLANYGRWTWRWPASSSPWPPS